MISPLDEYLTVTQLVEKAGVSTQAIRKAIKEERLEAEMKGNQYLIKKEDATYYI